MSKPAAPTRRVVFVYADGLEEVRASGPEGISPWWDAAILAALDAFDQAVLDYFSNKGVQDALREVQERSAKRALRMGHGRAESERD